MPKRDLERMRELLLHLEKQEGEDAGWVWTGGDDFWRSSDQYQIDLAEQAGLLEGDYATIGSTVTDRLRITNEGHDYLDAIRDAGTWQRTREVVASQGGNMALELVKALALGFVRKQIEDRTGMKL